jgi:group I intron endonuclease
MSGGIYIIECVSNKTIYVGSAKDFEGRWTNHLNSLKAGRHINPHLQNSFNKYGEASFICNQYFVILGEYNKNVFFDFENEIMNELRLTTKLFNVAKAEGGWTYATAERKEEIKQKVSNTLKARYANMSAEERSKIHGSTKGKHLSDEHKRKTSEGLKGIKRSDDTKKRMSEAQLKRTDLKECGRKVGRLNIGRLPPNTRKVLIDNIEFVSLKEAALHLELTSAAIIKIIKKGSSKYGNIRYKEEKEGQWQG